MFPIVQHKETIFHETLLNHFMENKVEIANAITKPFPFLESLRDRSFITEKIYNDSKEACNQLVPVGRVVYRILCHLEKTFHQSLLQTLFSRVHLKEYPDLIQVQRSFENVVQDKYFSWGSAREETCKMPSTQPSCERVSGKSKALGIRKEREPEELPSLQLNGGQGAELPTYENLVQSCAMGLVDMQKTISSCHPQMNEGQQARSTSDQVPEIIVTSSESRGQEAPPEAQSSAPRCGPGEEGEDCQPRAAEGQLSERRVPVS